MARRSQADLLIIGGGINGVGIARDAVGRGLSVILCEQGDLGGATSSASSKLIHGGLRYLEYYEFRLVREALIEREVLLRNAPHIIRPMRFVLPHDRSLRPAWMVRLGLFLYDHLGGRERLPGSRRVDLRREPAGAPLQKRLSTGFEYSDCWVEDARLVVLNALDAAERGADIRPRTRCVAARRTEAGWWSAELEDLANGTRVTVEARALVNAGGPWVYEILSRRLGLNSAKRVRLVKGSHIVVPRLYDGEHAYILQNDDRRIVFVIPYERDFTLIGTTDVPFAGDPSRVEIDAAETAYLCAAVSRCFARPVMPAQIVWSYAGVRPLYDDAAPNAAAVTRDYVLDIDDVGGRAVLLSVFGGKITTYRRLAEHALEKLAPYFPDSRRSWTADAPLPGGDMADAEFDRFLATLRAVRPFLPPALALRLARAYGTRVERLLGDARSMADLGEDFGGGLTRAEVDYLVRTEWAATADDILWRRSKLGLHVPPATRAALDAYLAGGSAGAAAPTAREAARR